MLTIVVPACVGVCVLGLVIGLAVWRARALSAAVHTLPRALGPALGFTPEERGSTPEWWMGELDGRPVGVTAVTAQISGFDNQKSTVLVLRLAVGVRRELPWNFRYHFSRPAPTDADAVFANLPDVPEAARAASLAFLARWSGLYVGPGRKLQHRPPAALTWLVAHDTSETGLSVDAARARLHALVAVADAVESNTP